MQTLNKNIEHDVIIGESNKLAFDHLFTGMKHLQYKLNYFCDLLKLYTFIYIYL